ncbi:MAG TPA: TIGR02594 family protein [Pseudolabrys sp.]|nr:TIGR02594 family protein [Pseudolabrys sp.]
MRYTVSLRAALAVVLVSFCVPALAGDGSPRERFINNEPLEQVAHSRADVMQAAAQVPGAAALLLEALRWRGRTAHQIGLPSSLWCADFMNFVIKKSGASGTGSRAARSFLQYGHVLDEPRVGAIAVFSRGGANSGHVGVVRGTDGNGNPIIVSGNYAQHVREAVYPKARVVAYVMPPDYVLREMASAALKVTSR